MKYWKLSLTLCAAIILTIVGYGFYPHTPKRPYLTVIGYARAGDGLGRQTVEIINNFTDDLSIGFIKTHKNRLEDVPDKVQKIIKTNNHVLGKVILFEDCLWWPGHLPFKKLQGPTKPDQIRIAYSMFESTRIPDEWTVILNTYFDAVAVPDPFLIDVYKNSGVTIPIFVVPLAVDLSPFLQQPLKTERGTPFVFANFGTCVNRKNQMTILHAFAKAFGNSGQVRLRINARDAYNKLDKEILQEIERLQLTNVDFSIKPLSNEEYLRLFKTIDCFVSLSKGEGFSIQPREAMALGIPSIVTDNTAQSTLCKSGLVKPVRSSLAEPAFFDWGEYYGNFSNCSVNEAAEAMLDLYDHYDRYLEQGAQARNWVKQYLYSELKPLYNSLIRPEKVFFGDDNLVTEEYLMTSSKELFEKYQALSKKTK